ncbi:hypothetical protein DICSQDRAFT_71736 [Dichomitus squalens LYAD-421 SS1]|uniref:Uncharacterized protein n=1 Tax=Dichomitus squalens (strain LYAD-421) TaxID=732165 RepID=R7SKR0_DICSQ|nr:uncharacterized protein DICSQDRAFT_71736 [Dichomitus squalens LYAD-421 SS1]EJF56320.1 hypothetical protein DICSQDRAFT_71736 [Dichomitus squalens LYAD-421 SS1]
MATSTADAIGRIRIDPLTGVEDWPSWRVQMEDLLYGLGLWDYVIEEGKPTAKDTKAPTTEEKKALEDWMKKDRTALIAIRMRVSKSLVHTLTRCVSSADAWNRLVKNYEPKGILHVVQIHRKLLQARYSDSENVEEFLQEMVRLRETLATMGHALMEEEFAITLLTALPDSWDPMVSSINHATDLKDADEIIARIRQHASRINDSEPKKDGPKALAAEEDGSDSDSDEYAYALIEQVDSDLDEDSEELALAARVARDAWVSDSATTVHVARARADFFRYTPTPGDSLKGAGVTPILGRGDVKIEYEYDRRKTIVELRNVVHAPGIPHNLIALGRVEAGGHSVTLQDGKIVFKNSKGRAYAEGTQVDNLYVMRATTVHDKTPDLACAAAVTRPRRKRTYDEWHRTLSHISMKAVIAMKTKRLVEGMEVDERVPPAEQCEACVRAKQTVAPYPKKSATVVAAIGDLTVMDLWGKAPTIGIRGEKFFSTFH